MKASEVLENALKEQHQAGYDLGYLDGARDVRRKIAAAIGEVVSEASVIPQIEKSLVLAEKNGVDLPPPASKMKRPSRIPREGTNARQVYDCVVENPGFKSSDIADYLGMGIDAVAPNLSQLKTRGLIMASATGGRAYLYYPAGSHCDPMLERVMKIIKSRGEGVREKIPAVLDVLKAAPATQKMICAKAKASTDKQKREINIAVMQLEKFKIIERVGDDIFLKPEFKEAA